MSWTEVVIEVARDHAEALSDALMEAGALSVSVEDADEGTDAERPLFGEPGMEPKEAAWDHSRVVALTDVDADQFAIVQEAANAVRLPVVPSFTTRAVADADWVRLTQSQFEPIHIGTNIWVEFEGGNIDAPIWAGCFWGDGDCPGQLPQVKIIKTQAATITLDEVNAASPVVIETPSGNRITITAQGITLESASGAKVELSGPQVSINNGALEVT